MYDFVQPRLYFWVRSHTKKPPTVKPPWLYIDHMLYDNSWKKIMLKKNMTSTVDDFCETSNSDVLSPMLLSLRGVISIYQADTFPALTALKVNTFWPPWFLLYHLLAISDLYLTPFLSLWLGSSIFVSPHSNHCLYFHVSDFPLFLRYDMWLTIIWKYQAKLSQLPSHNLNTPLPCLALKLLINQIGMLKQAPQKLS